VLFGESEELLFEDVFKLLDCGRSQTVRLGIGQITLDSLFHYGQRPRLFDFVSVHRNDLVFPSQALGLLSGPCLRRDAHAAGTARGCTHDPFPATATTPGGIVLLWAFGEVCLVWTERMMLSASFAYKIGTNSSAKNFSQSKSMIVLHLIMVEAAGVEPASEIAVSQESSCFVRFLMFSLQALRTDKMRRKLVR
jgi:hypothetical protein